MQGKDEALTDSGVLLVCLSWGKNKAKALAGVGYTHERTLVNEYRDF